MNIITKRFSPEILAKSGAVKDKIHCTSELKGLCLFRQSSAGSFTLRLTADLLQQLFLELKLVRPPKRAYRFGDMTKGLLKSVNNTVKNIVYYQPEQLELCVLYTPWKEQNKMEVAEGLNAKLRDLELISSVGQDKGEFTWYGRDTNDAPFTLLPLQRFPYITLITLNVRSGTSCRNGCRSRLSRSVVLFAHSSHALHDPSNIHITT